MSMITYDSVKVGDRLPEHVCGPITRTTLALFAGGSGDYMPLHIDSDFCKKAGIPDVFAHGMLSMAYLAQLLTKWVPQSQIVNWNTRFISITPVNATVLCNGEVMKKYDDQKRVLLSINTKVKDGAETLSGEALIALP